MLAILAFYYGLILNGNIDPIVVKDYIVVEALAVGVDPQLALKIANDESGFHPDRIGDHGTSYGIWQIHLPAHKDISPNQAEDIIWSTNWSLNELKEGNCRIWSTCPLIDS